jgi:hypothetical protein
VPITYHIDEVAARVTLEFLGTVTDADLMETFHRLYRDPRHRLGMGELTDCRRVERVEITGEGLQRLAEATARLLDGREISWKVAVLVPAESELMFGLSRMYELLREGSPEQVRVFRDAREAEEWLRRL